MPQRQTSKTGAPARSASAARAHAIGDVTWTIDLTQPATVGVQRRVQASRSYAAVGLSLLTAAIWLFNIATLVTRSH